jgi:hypothetical protein
MISALTTQSFIPVALNSARQFRQLVAQFAQYAMFTPEAAGCTESQKLVAVDFGFLEFLPTLVRTKEAA